MSSQPISSLTEINDKLLAGKAALEKTEIQDLIQELQAEFSRVVREKQFKSNSETSVWLNIMEGIFSSGLAGLFMEKIEKDTFFSFGEYLASLPGNSDPNVASIIHSYLNLFRYSVISAGNI